jgi:hypothetical protein
VKRVNNDLKFRKCTQSKNVIKQRFTVKSCTSNFLFDANETVLLKSNLYHNHETSVNINRQVVTNSLKFKTIE